MKKDFEVKVEDISQHYLSALTRAVIGERTISIDEMTGIQARERALPSLPMRPGKVERREARIYSTWYTNEELLILMLSRDKFWFLLLTTTELKLIFWHIVNA